jgi:hypothetical protein
LFAFFGGGKINRVRVCPSAKEKKEKKNHGLFTLLSWFKIKVHTNRTTHLSIEPRPLSSYSVCDQVSDRSGPKKIDSSLVKQTDGSML